jgi:bacterioferritin-associated ferredoxin
MYVCVCLAVTDSEVQSAVDAGASTVAQVTSACRAGGDCGACHSMIEQMIESAAQPDLLPACALNRASRAA